MSTNSKPEVPAAGAARRLLAIFFIAFFATAAQRAAAHGEAAPRSQPAAPIPAADAGKTSGGPGAVTATGAPAVPGAAVSTFTTPDGATPRVSARGEHLEITALRDHGTLTLYLDDYATNTPVTDAQVIVELGSASGTAAPQPDGSYRWAHDSLDAAPADTVVRFTVAAGSDAEQIETRLPAGADAAAHRDEGGAAHLPRSAWIGIAAAAAALLLACVLWRRARRTGHALAAPAGT
ncbi:hypothetical protein [Xylophilus sp. Leaf220]|uniref:hypothetical protein n=1 Tax=Xylophilus sp. Leaf220 TaxID=1735686 RepID=UPI0012E2B317|nr:hypothetical protein [Xylophilus sp. Leaf220]